MPSRSLVAAVLLVLACGPGIARAADGIPLSQAEERAETLYRLLRRSRAANDEIAQALTEVEEAYGRLQGDPAPEGCNNEERWLDDQDRGMDRFRERAEKLFLKALALEKVDRDRDLNERHPLQFQAARALGRTRAQVAEDFQRVLEREVIANSDYRKDPSFYDVAFRALAGLGDPETFDWLLERGVNADVTDEDKHRALAALHVMMDLPDVTGEQRRAAVRRLIDIYQSYAFHWQNKYDAVAGFRSGSRKYVKIAGVQDTYWMDVRPVVLAALRQFSIDPRTGRPPLDPKTGAEWETVPEWLNWYHRVGRRGMPPWVEGPTLDVGAPEGRATLDHQAPPLSVFERAFGIPWQRWWRGRERPPHRSIPAEETGGSDEAPAPDREAFLAALRKERLPAVFERALAAESHELRAAAALGLGKVKAAEAKPRLLRVLAEDRHERVREAAVLGLLCLGDPTLEETFRGLLKDPQENARCRAYAVLALGLLGKGADVWAVLGERRPEIEADGDVVEDLQAAAVVAVGLSRATALAPALLDVLESRRWPEAARARVGGALAALAEGEVVDGLLRVLRQASRDEDDAHVAASAAFALGALVADDDGKTIRRVAAPVVRPKGKFGGARNAVALALGRIGGLEAEKLLIEAWEERVKDTTRYAERGFLLLALAQVDTSAARALVRQQVRELDHEHDLAAGVTAVALAGDRWGIGPVRDRTKTSEHLLTGYGIVALGMLGDADAAVLARQALEQRHEPQLVRQALTALALIEAEGALPELEAWWTWSPSHEHLDALAWAFVPAASPAAEALLTRWAEDASLAPPFRAYALVALGRMADPDPDPVLTRLGREANPYAEAPTLDLIARYADVPFFR